jgi:uncharacterized MnhB-related membrane protein
LPGLKNLLNTLIHMGIVGLRDAFQASFMVAPEISLVAAANGRVFNPSVGLGNCCST